MRLTLILVTLCLLSGCANLASKDEGTPPYGYTAPSRIDPAIGPRSELLLRALGLVGLPYTYGGNLPSTGFDCSGLVHYVFGQAVGFALPRTAEEISRIGDQVQPDELEPGDLVFFNTLQRPFSHVGIYLGERRFIHAPSQGGQVEIVSMTERYWQKRYDGGRRIRF